MERLEWILISLDNSFDTRKKRHIAGGILLSVSMLFSGLAITVLTIRKEKENVQEEME